MAFQSMRIVLCHSIVLSGLFMTFVDCLGVPSVASCDQLGFESSFRAQAPPTAFASAKLEFSYWTRYETDLVSTCTHSIFSKECSLTIASGNPPALPVTMWRIDKTGCLACDDQEKCSGFCVSILQNKAVSMQPCSAASAEQHWDVVKASSTTLFQLKHRSTQLCLGVSLKFDEAKFENSSAIQHPDAVVI
mmetsp:Transcript_118124/g.227834  ORF Transcript_118124/g.227834 Transcript_118124/m.227834 type:complete len:191 (-) Transcript_118124:67-639(-)